MIENILNVVGVLMLVTLTLILALIFVWAVPQVVESVNDTIYTIKKDIRRRRKESLDD